MTAEAAGGGARLDHATIRELARKEIAPHADAIDREERIPIALIRALGRAGVLGAGLPETSGGAGLDWRRYGLLHAELARASASVEGLVNVHHMAAVPLSRWGSAKAREAWLPRLAAGEALAAFAISEPDVGTDAGSVRTEARAIDGGFVLDGAKKWITCGQVADAFVVLARCDGQPTAFLVERDRAGLSVDPIRGMLGCRGYMLAALELDGCRIPAENRIGRPGAGLAWVAQLGLDVGRFGLAWACTGMAEACLEASVRHTSGRKQFGVPLREHQLVQRLLTRMVVAVRAARLQCEHAARMRDARDPRSAVETCLAKYVASTELQDVASATVQVHGALGCSRELGVERVFRDARIMEVIEGTSQIHELTIAQHAEALAAYGEG